MRKTLITLAGLALTAPLVAATPASAGIQGPTGSTVEARGLLAPLSLDVDHRGAAWFSQNFAGILMKKPADGPARVVYRNPGGAEVGAVTASGPGTAFATTSNSGRALLKEYRRGEGARNVANLSRFEKKKNPDAGATYGILDLDEGCDVPPFLRPYTGIVESHPYATTTMRRVRYVADAAANAILGVDADGRVTTTAVLPPQPVEITPEAAEANEIPECAVGETFAFEPVPTDVEVGPGGLLYVTTLPGGPEDPSLGARAAVHTVDPATGEVETIATGLLSATGLAVARNGDMYVAELFGGRIAKVPAGSDSPTPWASAQLPGDVELAGGELWATRKVLTGLEGGRPAGQVVRYEGGIAPAR